MNFQGADLVFLLVVGVATYAYAAFIFSKEPDPSTEFGISLNAMLAGLLALGATIVAFVIVLLAGKIGYAIVIIAYPFTFPRIIKKMLSGDKRTPA
jgi:hypothetical protein